MAQSRDTVPATDLGQVVWPRAAAATPPGAACSSPNWTAGGGSPCDSKDHNGPALLFDRAEVTVLVAGIKAGRHDYLLATT